MISLSIGIGLTRTIGQAGPTNPITGTGPVLAPLTDGDTLSSAVTWGSYLPGGATADRQMRVDGGAWVAYVGGTVVAEGEVWEAREVVSYGGFTSTFASAAQTVAEAPSVMPFTRENVIAEAMKAGRTSTAPLKIPGVDPMPAGASYGSGVITVSGNDVVFENWYINRITGAGLRCIIRQCEIEDVGTGGADYPISHSGTGWVFEGNNCFGQGDPRSSSALMVSGAANIAFRYNYLHDYGLDGLKMAGNDTLVEFNRFGPANNTAGVTVYSAGTYYAPGSAVTNAGTLWLKLSAAAAGTTPAEGANWTALDPHVDQITAYGGSGIIRFNYFEEQTAIFGATQRIRVIRNTGTSFDITPWQVYGNVMDDWFGAYPLSSDVVRGWTARTYAIGELCANAAGTIFYRATAVTSDNPAVDMTDWTLDRDLNVDSEILWAYNFVEAGTSGLFNASNAPNSFVGNSNAADAALGYMADNSAGPVIAAPVNVGDDLSYTPPTKVGPASVFTITPSVANGAARMGGVNYSNVVAIRVGIQLVALIDAAGYWYVKALSGVTMEDVGGGDYILRVYDASGALMDASVSIVAGSATVTAEADDASTGPAWGGAPTTTISNNVPFAASYTLIDCIGQAQETNVATFLTQDVDISGLGLVSGDFVISMAAMGSNTNRSVSITTSGFTTTNAIFANSNYDANGAVGFKQMSGTPDTAVVSTSGAAAGANPFVQVARGYRGVASVSRATATGTNTTPNPPSVTATKDNSIAVVVGVVCHNQGEIDMSAGYGSNPSLLKIDSGYDLTIVILEVEIQTGVYDPPAMTFGGVAGAANSWWAATFLLTPP